MCWSSINLPPSPCIRAEHTGRWWSIHSRSYVGVSLHTQVYAQATHLRYTCHRFNTLTSILTYERPDLHLHLIYRLDRLVSGLTILAKSPAAARQFSHELQAGQTQKVYLARVIGDLRKTDRFPVMAEPAVVSTGSVEGGEEVSSGEDSRLPEILFEQWLTEKPKRKGRPRELGRMEGEEEKGKPGKKRRKGKAGEALEGEPGEDEEDEEEEDVPMEWRRQSDGSILVRTGIRCVSFREGVQECSVRGKPSITVLRVRSFDGETSVVECRPVTGRTHQIRLHLQWLGHPIANDPNYGDEAAVEAYAKKYRLAEKEAHDKDYRYADGKCAEEGEGKEQPAVAVAGEEKEGTQAAAKDAPSDGMDVASDVAVVEKEETEEERIERVCPHCATGGLSHFRAQQLRHEGIWLHAWRYRGKAWSYETPLPEWAKEHGAGAEAKGVEEGAEQSAQVDNKVV